MKLKTILTLLLTVFFTISMSAQIALPITATNIDSHFKAGEFDVSAAPVLFMPQYATKSTYGFSFESEYWQTEHTGTGLELGTYDVTSTSGIMIDHVAVMEDIRLFLFPTTKFLDQFDFELKSAATTYLNDGAKDFSLGVGADFDIVVFNHHFRADLCAMNHFASLQKHDGFSAKFDIKLFSF